MRINLLLQIEAGPGIEDMPAGDQAKILAKAVAICLVGVQTSTIKDYKIKIPPGCFVPVGETI